LFFVFYMAGSVPSFERFLRSHVKDGASEVLQSKLQRTRMAHRESARRIDANIKSLKWFNPDDWWSWKDSSLQLFEREARYKMHEGYTAHIMR
jgi:hypothetical protein